jgi:hypothetical protein
MPIRVVKIDRMYDLVVLELEFDPFLAERILRSLEVSPVHAEGEMVDGQAGRQRDLGVIRGEKGDGRISDPDHAREIPPDIFVEALQAEHVLIPLHGCANIFYRQANMIDALDFEHMDSFSKPVNCLLMSGIIRQHPYKAVSNLMDQLRNSKYLAWKIIFLGGIFNYLGELNTFLAEIL